MSVVPEPLPPPYSRDWLSLFRFRALRWFRDHEATAPHYRQALTLGLGLSAEHLRVVLGCKAFVECAGAWQLSEMGQRAAAALPPIVRIAE